MGIVTKRCFPYIVFAIMTVLFIATPVVAAQIDFEGLSDGVYLVDMLAGSATKLPEVQVDRSNEPRELLVTLPKTDSQPLIVGKFNNDTFERNASGYILVKLPPSLNPKVKRIETGFGSRMKLFNDPLGSSIAAFLVGYPEELTIASSQEYLKLLFVERDGEKGEEDAVPLSAIPIVNNVPNGIRLDFCLPLQMAQVSAPTQVVLEISTDVGTKSYAFTVGEEGLYIFRPGQFPEPLNKLATWNGLKTEKWWNAKFETNKVSFDLEGVEYEGPISFKSTTELKYMFADASRDGVPIKAMPTLETDSKKITNIEVALDITEILQVNKQTDGSFNIDWSSLYYTDAYRNGTRTWLLANDGFIWTPIVLE